MKPLYEDGERLADAVETLRWASLRAFLPFWRGLRWLVQTEKEWRERIREQ